MKGTEKGCTMLQVALGPEVFESGDMVKLGFVPAAVAAAKKHSNPMDFERKFWPRINAAIVRGVLTPVGHENLEPLSAEEAGNGLVPLSQLIAWGRALDLFEFVRAPGSVPLNTELNARSNSREQVQMHSTKDSRRDILTPVIEDARKICRNPNDVAEVWSRLQVMAERKEPPMIGVTDEGVQYLKNGQAKFLSLSALRKRLQRAPDRR
jgi:hypothetical protein